MKSLCNLARLSLAAESLPPLTVWPVRGGGGKVQARILSLCSELDCAASSLSGPHCAVEIFN